jgi:hypothetical protein
LAFEIPGNQGSCPICDEGRSNRLPWLRPIRKSARVFGGSRTRTTFNNKQMQYDQMFQQQQQMINDMNNR